MGGSAGVMAAGTLQPSARSKLVTSRAASTLAGWL